MPYQPKIVSKTPKLFDLGSPITFGKYKPDDLVLAQVISLDAEYVQWCIDNIDWFDVTPEVQDTVDKLLNMQDKDIGLDYQNDFDRNFSPSESTRGFLG